MNDEEVRSFTNYFLSSEFDALPGSCESSDMECSGDEQKQQHSMYNQPDNEEMFKYTVSSVGFGGTVRGFKILRQLEPHRQSTVQASFVNKSVGFFGMFNCCYMDSWYLCHQFHLMTISEHYLFI